MLYFEDYLEKMLYYLTGMREDYSIELNSYENGSLICTNREPKAILASMPKAYRTLP